METVSIRPISKSDNEALANIIRNALIEFNANHPGTVFDDPTTDHLYELFQKEGSAYWVAVKDELILGGGGIYPSAGLETDTCELVKLYLSPEARGLGLGRQLIERCLSKAKENGYKRVYIESMPELAKAVGIYTKMGFTMLNGPMGNTGHTGCTIWMLKNL